MAAAYSVFANDGLRNEPYLVDRIEDRTGKVIYQHHLSPEPIVPPQTARLVNQVLMANVQGGTGTKAQIPSGQPAAGKTGTTNDSKISGSSATRRNSPRPSGWARPARRHPDELQRREATGGKFPALTWGMYMTAMLANQPIVPFLDADPTRAASC